MNSSCPHLPPAPVLLDWRELRRHGNDRGADFYLSALTYGQHLWQRGFSARALLAVDRALLAEVPAEGIILLQWPLPYRALRWIMENAPAGSLVGNPRVHYQHLAGRIRGPRAAVQQSRAWAAWHLARLANPAWGGDAKHQIQEPTNQETALALNSHGLPGETAIWLAALQD